MNQFLMDWHENEKRKKEDRYEKNQLSILNRNLQRILHQIERKIEKDLYKRQEQHVDRQLVSSHIWNLGYLNNLESKKVALEQGVFISLILHCEESLEERTYLKREVERFMSQLGHFDYSLVGEFNRRKQLISRMAKQEGGLQRIY